MSASPVGTPLHKFPEPELGHAMIPKDIFARDLRQSIRVV